MTRGIKGILLFTVVLVAICYAPMTLAAMPAADSIPSKDAPSVVGRVFLGVFGRDINVTESDYWKKRARSDKNTELALHGAMFFQKARGRTMPTAALPKPKPAVKTNVACGRSDPYFLAPELQQGMTVLKNGLLSKEPWKSKIPLSKFQNCLRIKFANKPSEYALVSGALGVFFTTESLLNDLRIVINPAFAKDGHVLLGETLAHEITHAWQFIQTTLAIKNVAGFTTYIPPDCFDTEAEAFWTEISYIDTLAEADENDLRDVLRDAVTFSPNTKRGAGQVLNLMSFATRNSSQLVANPIRFLRVNFVMTIPAYVAQCS